MDPNDWTLTGNANTNPPGQFLGTTDNHPLVLKTNGTEAVHIDTVGRVGIGTNNPAFRLQVTTHATDSFPQQRGLAIQSPNSSVGAGLQLQTTGPGGRGWELLATGASSAQGEGKFNIRDLGDGSDDFTITSGGSVGIGNTDPQAKLDVAGDTNNIGVLGTGRIGVFGQSSSPNDGAVVGENSDNGPGVHGLSSAGSGVLGETRSTGAGVGVRGISTAPLGAGVYGDNPNGVGVFATSANGAGVDASGGVYGVFANSANPSGIGVFANAPNFGVYTTNSSVPGGNQAYLSGPVFAGAFFGPVFVQGPLSKPGGGFQIDHPLDPARKYFFHSFVESPEMKNIYDGVVVLDANGEALIELPAWFEALNTDFRYQLTSIGAPAPNLHIAEEIANNRFKIAGGTPNLKVSWLVTGIRQDAWANAHRLSVEVDKPAEEQGYYLHPELYGASEEQHIRRVHYPEPTQLLQSREQMRESQDRSR